MAAIWAVGALVMFLAALLVALYSCLVVASEADDAAEQAFEELRTVTTPEPRATVRYPVPLDDDLQQYIVELSIQHDIAPCIIFAQIGVESAYQPDIIGDNGNSYGLMQIYRSVHEERMERLGVMDLLDPYQNVRVGIDIMSELMSWGHGIEWALSYYNGHGGEPCDYARTVLCNAEQIMEGVMMNDG